MMKFHFPPALFIGKEYKFILINSFWHMPTVKFQTFNTVNENYFFFSSDKTPQCVRVQINIPDYGYVWKKCFLMVKGKFLFQTLNLPKKVALACMHCSVEYSGCFLYDSAVRIHLQCRRHRRLRRHGFDSCIRKIPWSGKWKPTPVFFLGKSHGQRSLVDYSPKGHKESDTAEHRAQWSLGLKVSELVRLDW